MLDLTPELLGAWVEAYERAWRDGPTADLTGLSTPDAEYLVESYAAPPVGLHGFADVTDDVEAAVVFAPESGS